MEFLFEERQPHVAPAVPPIMRPGRRLSSCPLGSEVLRVRENRHHHHQDNTSFIWGWHSASSKQAAKSWKDARKESIKTFYEDPLTKKDPVLPEGWKEYRDKDGFHYFAGPKNGRATFDKPPLPPLPSQKCLGTDLIREYQSPGILATNIFNTCQFRCNGGLNSFGPSMVFREPVEKVHVRVVNRSSEAKNAEFALGKDDLADDAQMSAPPPEQAEQVLLDSDVALRKPGVMNSTPKMEVPFCASEDDLLPRRYEITVTDATTDAEKNGQGTNFIGKVILRAHARDGYTYNFPGDDALDKHDVPCSIL